MRSLTPSVIMMKKDQHDMTFSAIWVGLFFSIGFVIKESRSEFGFLFALTFIILSVAEIIVERKLSNYKKVFPILKAVITYFIFILVGYMFLGTSMKKLDDTIMLFIYALFPAKRFTLLHFRNIP